MLRYVYIQIWQYEVSVFCENKILIIPHIKLIIQSICRNKQIVFRLKQTNQTLNFRIPHKNRSAAQVMRFLSMKINGSRKKSSEYGGWSSSSNFFGYILF